MNILIVKTSAIGDVLHTLPALQALRRRYPEAHIAWLVEEAAAPIVLGHPALDQVLVAKRRSWVAAFRAGRWWSTALEVWLFIKQLRARPYDLLIDFQGLLKSSLWIACCRARRKVGFGPGMAHSEGSYLLLSERLPPVDMDIHAVDRELLLLAAIGVPAAEVEYTLPLSAADHDQATTLLAAHGITADQALVVINPLTTWPTKHWSDQGFALVADRLIDQDMKIVFSGGLGDRGRIEAIIGLMQRPGAVNLAGVTGLKTLAAIQARARLLITTDTGPMHLAAAVHTPVVALFGPTAPWRTGPYGQAGHQIVRLDLPCSPCFKRRCPLATEACMQGIGVDDVLAAVMRILEANPEGNQCRNLCTMSGEQECA